jgi:hypothetical protein
MIIFLERLSKIINNIHYLFILIFGPEWQCVMIITLYVVRLVWEPAILTRVLWLSSVPPCKCWDSIVRPSAINLTDCTPQCYQSACMQASTPYIRFWHTGETSYFILQVAWHIGTDTVNKDPTVQCPLMDQNNNNTTGMPSMGLHSGWEMHMFSELRTEFLITV